MTKKEAIDALKLMQAQIEWDYPMDYSVAIDMAIDALASIDQYRWERDIAIDQLHSLGYELGEKPRRMSNKELSVEAIRNLPSSQSDASDCWGCNCPKMERTLGQPEIIYCKDCKHGSPNGKYGCRVYHYKRYEAHDMKPDDFCSKAERREE